MWRRRIVIVIAIFILFVIVDPQKKINSFVSPMVRIFFQQIDNYCCLALILSECQSKAIIRWAGGMTSA